MHRPNVRFVPSSGALFLLVTAGLILPCTACAQVDGGSVQVASSHPDHSPGLPSGGEGGRRREALFTFDRTQANAGFTGATTPVFGSIADPIAAEVAPVFSRAGDEELSRGVAPGSSSAMSSATAQTPAPRVMSAFETSLLEQVSAEVRYPESDLSFEPENTWHYRVSLELRSGYVHELRGNFEGVSASPQWTVSRSLFSSRVDTDAARLGFGWQF